MPKKPTIKKKDSPALYSFCELTHTHATFILKALLCGKSFECVDQIWILLNWHITKIPTTNRESTICIVVVFQISSSGCSEAHSYSMGVRMIIKYVANFRYISSAFPINFDFSLPLIVIARNFIECDAVLSSDHESLGCVHCSLRMYAYSAFVSFYLVFLSFKLIIIQRK